MKRILETVVLIMMIITILSLGTIAFATELPNHEYVDFSSDRSTWFFKTEGGKPPEILDKKPDKKPKKLRSYHNDVAFFDFFSPFDPTVKVETYDPLAMYKLDNPYHFDNGVLMINIDDLKKLYDPYFDYEIIDDTLNIRHTVYDKLLLDGFGRRATL